MGGVLCVLDKWVAGILGSFAVAPCAGAGIEINHFNPSFPAAMSPPARGRGLKYASGSAYVDKTNVAPCAGAGIEIRKLIRQLGLGPGRPLRGGGD